MMAAGETIRLKAPKGLGDAIYQRAVALHFLDQGYPVEVFTRWPDVFADLPVTVLPVASMTPTDDDLRPVGYSTKKPMPEGMNEFTIRCVKAGIVGPAPPLRIDWKVRNKRLLDRIKAKAGGRKILIYQPLKTIKNEWMELLRPRREAYIGFLRDRGDCFRIKLGHPPYTEDDPKLPCEIDLFGKGFIFDTFDVCTIGDSFFGEICFIHTIAEAMDKPVTVMFARRGLESDTWVRGVTPSRLFHKTHLATAVYDE